MSKKLNQQERAKSLAERIIKKYKEEETKIINKYIDLYKDKFANCADDVWNSQNIELYHGFKKEFPKGYDNSWDNQLEDGIMSGKLEKMRRDTSDHDKLGFLPQEVKYINENTPVAQIKIKSFTENPTPIWEPKNTEGNIDDWIIDGKIRPLPPKGMWWDKDYWESIHYPAVEVYDIIEKDVKFQNLKKEFYKKLNEELNKTYTRILNETVEAYFRNVYSRKNR